jgi:hypothetical protein
MHRFFSTLIYSFLIFTTFSCGNKSADGVLPAYFVKAKINGVDFFHNASNKNQMMNYSEPNGYVNATFSLHVSPNNVEQFGFTCLGYEHRKPETMIMLGGGYSKGKTEIYAANSAVQANGKCSITKIDDKVIEGTFYFDAFSENGVGTTKISITEGQFRLEF